MKKLLILIVAAAVFLHFYPQPKLEKWALEQKEWILEKFSSATDTRVRLNPEKVRSELEMKFGQFNENEREYVMEISSSRESIKAFYVTECANLHRHQNYTALIKLKYVELFLNISHFSKSHKKRA